MNLLLFKRPLFLLIFFTISISSLTIAQPKGTLRGVVTDSTSGEALAYGNVFIQELNIGASTDARGYFLIRSIPANTIYTLIVSYVGYNKKNIPVNIEENRMTHLDIVLSPSSIELQTIEKVGERVAEVNATDIGLQRIAMRDLEALPKGVETDIFRSLQYMPGVRSTGDVSARYYVRGGTSNQNLVLLNDAPIYNPFHALGMFSVIDPEMINNVEFYKGGFTSEYGGRLSSVLKLITKDGNKNQYGATFGASQMTAKAMLQGPIPFGSFMITGRKSYSTAILKKFLDEKSAPIDFYDLSFKMNYSNPDFMPISKFSIHAFFSGDKLSNDDPTREDFLWSNKVIGFKWFQAAADSPLFFELGLSYSRFDGEVVPNFSSVKRKDNELDDITLQMDFTYVFESKDEIGIGLKIADLKTSLFLENAFGALSEIGSHGTNISIYGKYKFLRFENFGADIGTRLNLTKMAAGTGSEYMFEPRFSVTYRIFPQLALKAAWGYYIQELTTLSDETEIISLFEPWLITPSYLDPARATHSVVGLEFDWGDNLAIDIESYYKFVRNLPTINANKFFSSDPDLIPGSLESYGAEFFMRYRLDPFNMTVAYTFSRAYKEVEGWVYYPKYDSRHTANVSLECNFGNNWRGTVSWFYSSQLPFTQSIGFYDKFYFNDLYLSSPIYESYRPYSILDDINLGRLPDYHRLDISVSKKFEFGFMNLYLDLSIINVYNRENLFYFKRDTGERVNMLPFLPTATIKVEL
ncbi:carboxypeptidase-like regulatory domain-containing protein [Bacteroidota bacterium]